MPIWAGCLLDSRRAVLRRTPSSRRPEEELRPAVPAARHHDDARPALQHRVPLRRDPPVGRLSERARQHATRRSRCCRRVSRRCRTSGSTTTTPDSSSTGGARPPGSGRLVSLRARRLPGAPNWLPTARGERARRGRESRCVPCTLDAIAADRRARLAARGRPPRSDAIRCRGAIELLQPTRQQVLRHARSVPERLGRARASWPGCARNLPRIRPGTIYDARPGVGRPSTSPAIHRFILRAAESAADARLARAAHGRSVRSLHRQLPQRLHLTACRSVSRSSYPGIALHVVRAHLDLVRQRAGAQLGGTRRPLPHVQGAGVVDVSLGREPSRRWSSC